MLDGDFAHCSKTKPASTPETLNPDPRLCDPKPRSYEEFLGLRLHSSLLTTCALKKITSRSSKPFGFRA